MDLISSVFSCNSPLMCIASPSFSSSSSAGLLLPDVEALFCRASDNDNKNNTDNKDNNDNNNNNNHRFPIPIKMMKHQARMEHPCKTS